MNSGPLSKFILIALIFPLLFASPAYAAAFTANDHATLDSAITSANTNSEPDTITIMADITLTADLPAISTYIAFRSSDGNRFTISGNNARRIFTVTSGGRLSIQNLVITNGNSGNAAGGAIHVTSGELELLNAVVRNSTAGTPGSFHSGGGIYVTGTASNPPRVSITNSSIHNNLADYEGGGIYAHSVPNFSMFRSAVYSNESKSATSGGGGLVLRNYGDTPASYSIVNSSIFNNKTASRGAGIFASLSQSQTTSVLTLRHVTITGNTTTSTNTYAGAGLFSTAAKVTLQNSIIYGNKRNADTASNCIFSQTPTTGPNVPVLAHNIIGAGSNSDSPPHCTPNGDPSDPLLAASPEGSPPYFNLRPGSPAIDSIPNAACRPASEGGDRDQRGRTRPNTAGGACDKGAIEYYAPPPPPQAPAPPSDDTGGSGGGGSDDDDDETLKAVLAKPVSTCLTLEGIAASNLTESTQCQRLDAMQIANPDIKEGDFVDAVDVWSWVQPNTEICFEALGGSVTFIDTAAMPRTAHEAEAYSKGGMTCATVDGPGILVLMSGDRPALAAADSATKAAPAVPAAQGLSNCMVRTQFNLNFRDGPDGEIVGEVPHNATLTALERTAGWFKVDYHGERGWISAEYVDKKGTCG